MSEEKKSFAEWALVELMGHQRIVGYVTEQTIAGNAMLRVDVPNPDGSAGFTRFYGGGAIYAINPIDKDTAIKLATNTDSAPVKAYQLPAAPKPQTSLYPEAEIYNNYEDDEDDEEDIPL